jgi:uncharacterized repeat protein (TIGR01451 family)
VSRSRPPWFKSQIFKNCLWGLLSLAATIAIFAHSGIAQEAKKMTITNAAQSIYNDPTGLVGINGNSNLVTVGFNAGGLVDPLGIVTGCDGKALASYAGYKISLYNASTDKLNLTSLLPLTPTVAADGVAPNIQNINPFALMANGDGRYNFLFDRNQLAIGSSYILVVQPPANSTYGERRVRLDITGFDGDVLSYQATTLDGKPLSTIDNSTKSTSVAIDNAAKVGLSLISFPGMGTTVCDSQPLQIIKTADRATAEPGDTVVYLLTLKNQSDRDLNSLTVTDTLPQGMVLRTESVRAQLGSISAPVTVTQQGNVATFKIAKLGFAVPARQVINLGYAVTLNADAIRGTGINSAILTAQRSDGTTFTDGPATHTLSIRQGLIQDTGTIIGRVFVDKNFDGEQQANEPGIPNAVIFLDNGNRITTDVNGMYSVQSAATGYRTGTLDLTSLPGYSLAPNRYFSERNSLSRLVKLAPGGIVRMNFGVTPTAREVKK